MRDADQSFTFRRSLRLRGYDYRQAGAYFVTLCTQWKRKRFGTVKDGEMLQNDLGKVVSEQWEHVAKARSNIQLDLYVVMPNHLHGVIIIDDNHCKDSFGRMPSSFSRRSRTLLADSLGAIIGQFKAAVTRRAMSLHIDCDKKFGNETITNISFVANGRCTR